MANSTAQGARKTYVAATVLIVVMFAIWGLSHRLYGTLLPAFVTALSLNDFQVSFANWLNSLGYCLMAIPAAFFIRNLGYKSGVVGGLGCFAVGMFLFYPAAEQHEFTFLLGAGLLAHSGLALLEIAADPLIMQMGPAESAIRRLNIAQALNPLGQVFGFFLGSWIMVSELQNPIQQLAHALVQPYFFIGVCVLFFAFIVDNVVFPPVANERVARQDSTIDNIAQLLKSRMFVFAMAALFLYIVGQSFLWDFAIRYVQGALPGGSSTSAADILLWSLFAFMIGRFVGTALMFRFEPVRLLAVYAGAAAILTAFAALLGGRLGVPCILGASFFLSIVFPTIFGCAVRDLGPHIKSASALLIMASGSANMVLPIIKLISGPGSIQYMALIPSLCLCAILVFAVVQRRAASRQLKHLLPDAV
ncbi:MAG: MFS transporter [Rhizomicrobium sp.]|jgi:FHS family L-fucose permease-like MFS transporter